MYDNLGCQEERGRRIEKRLLGERQKEDKRELKEIKPANTFSGLAGDLSTCIIARRERKSITSAFLKNVEEFTLG